MAKESHLLERQRQKCKYQHCNPPVFEKGFGVDPTHIDDSRLISFLVNPSESLTIFSSTALLGKQQIGIYNCDTELNDAPELVGTATGISGSVAWQSI